MPHALFNRLAICVEFFSYIKKAHKCSYTSVILAPGSSLPLAIGSIYNFILPTRLHDVNHLQVFLKSGGNVGVKGRTAKTLHFSQ